MSTTHYSEPVEGELLYADTSRPWNDVSPKVTGGALGAAASTIAVWGVEAGFGIDVPTSVEAAAALIIAFVLGYLIPDTR